MPSPRADYQLHAVFVGILQALEPQSGFRSSVGLQSFHCAVSLDIARCSVLLLQVIHEVPWSRGVCANPEPQACQTRTQSPTVAFRWLLGLLACSLEALRAHSFTPIRHESSCDCTRKLRGFGFIYPVKKQPSPSGSSSNSSSSSSNKTLETGLCL